MFVPKDRLLLDVLVGQPHGEVTAELDSGEVFSTSAWYYRPGALCSAARAQGLSPAGWHRSTVILLSKLLPAHRLVTTDAPLLRSAAEDTGIGYHVLA